MVTICARIHSGASSSPNVLKRMLEWTALAGGMRARRKNCSHAVNYCVLENACRILAYNQMCAACGGKVLCRQCSPMAKSQEIHTVEPRLCECEQITKGGWIFYNRNSVEVNFGSLKCTSSFSLPLCNLSQRDASA